MSPPGSSTAGETAPGVDAPEGATARDAAPPPVIEVRDVELSFGATKVLQGVNFELERGKTLCVLGGSGGGKSTLLKTMIGVLKPTAGRITLNGHNVCTAAGPELDRIRRGFGVMFQSGALLNSMTVAQNVALPLEYHTKLDAETIDTTVKIKLHQVDLLHAADRLPAQISGGMQKRAAVARALALDPRILFYDEPSAGLDPIATARLDDLVNQLRDTMGMTSVVVTHVLESVRRIADRIVMLDKGRVILDGTLEDLEASDDPRIAQFRTGETAGPNSGVVSEQQFLRDLLH
ncbi:MAG: ATP-binding cassette domain-containing protein [Planctomycetota bacterium]